VLDGQREEETIKENPSNFSREKSYPNLLKIIQRNQSSKGQHFTTKSTFHQKKKKKKKKPSNTQSPT
jgi:hypothetical protein